MSIQRCDSLSHTPDWTIGHVHSGALGGSGLSEATLYCLVPLVMGPSRGFIDSRS